MSFQRSKSEKKRLQKIYKATRGRHGAGVWFDERKGRLIKYSEGSIYSKRSLKRQCSKAARQYPGVLNNGKYKRTFDYFWELY